MTTVAFEQFLSQNKPRFVEIDGEPAAIFDPNAPVDEQHIDAAEARLGVQLPASLSSEDQEVVAVLAMTVPARPARLNSSAFQRLNVPWTCARRGN